MSSSFQRTESSAQPAMAGSEATCAEAATSEASSSVAGCSGERSAAGPALPELGLPVPALAVPALAVPALPVPVLPDPALAASLRFNEAGLIPAVAQDWLDGAVLMVAWMNREALERSLASGEVHYWSRSRQELWHKGASSGHFQKLRGLRYDCDADVLLLTVEQVGAVACHTGARSCFYDQGSSPSGGGANAAPPPADACTELMRVIEGRRDQPEAGSYTNRLLEGGDNRILKKIGEESAEFVMACKDNDPAAIAGEAADLVFHLQVALAHHGVGWRQVLAVLAARRGAPRRQ
jgi:phosphoribosyl-ATP pyrophosphohydrolase/phosphoribosyl-AMP cyclohydrolase